MENKDRGLLGALLSETEDNGSLLVKVLWVGLCSPNPNSYFEILISNTSECNYMGTGSLQLELVKLR